MRRPRSRRSSERSRRMAPPPGGRGRRRCAAAPGTPASMRSTPIFRALAARDRIRRLARRLGYEVRQYTPLRSLTAAREQLLDGVDVVLDVGANTGQYGALLRELGFAGRILSLEPVAEAFAELAGRAAADGAWEAVCVAASDVDG